MAQCKKCQNPCEEGEETCQNCKDNLSTTEADSTPSSSFDWFDGWKAPGGSY